MAFSDFGTLDDVARKYSIQYYRQHFIEPATTPKPSDYFRQEIDFTLEKFTYGRTEDSACESLIFPVLRRGLEDLSQRSFPFQP